MATFSFRRRGVRLHNAISFGLGFRRGPSIRSGPPQSQAGVVQAGARAASPPRQPLAWGPAGSLCFRLWGWVARPAPSPSLAWRVAVDALFGWFPSSGLGTLILQAPAWLFFGKLELLKPHFQAGDIILIH